MGTLKVKLRILYGEFQPVEYHLGGIDPTGHADVYYNFADIIGDIPYLETLQFYCVRKIDFSTMVNGTTKNFQTNHSKGTITFYQNPNNVTLQHQTITTSLRCIGLNRVSLINPKENINQASRKKLPHYMLASDLIQFKENVQFDATGGDNLRNHQRGSLQQGKWCCFTLNLFPNE
jgi:hypothetical protein